MTRLSRRGKKSRIKRYIDWATGQIFNLWNVDTIDDIHSEVSSDGITGKLVAVATFKGGGGVEVIEHLTIRPASGTYETAPGVWVRNHSYTILDPSGRGIAFDCDAHRHRDVMTTPYHRHRPGAKVHAEPLDDDEPRSLRELCVFLKGIR